jgi:transcriptional regulator with XRE-family HTH domain
MATPLADLIRTHCDRTGDTLADIAARGSMSRQTLSALVNRTDANQLPRASTIRKLATGLELPFELVRSVAQETAYGDAPIGQEHSRPVQVLIAYAEKLPERDVDVLLATARALMAPPDDGGSKATRQGGKGQKSSRGGLAVIR